MTVIWRALLLLALLGGCGTATQNNPALAQISDRITGEVAEFDPRFIALLRAEAPALQVGFPDGGTGGTLLLERRDGAFDYWLSPDGVQIVLEAGMLHGTRGLGDGLLASETRAARALVRGARAGVADRFHTYLDGEDFAVTRTFRCVIAPLGPDEVEIPGTGPVATILVREVCASLDEGFENLYWVVPSTGDIVVSRQWAGAETGALSTRVVVTP
ncbi:MAG: YjbF family lipoprotein [Pseudomonadota bacterium]